MKEKYKLETIKGYDFYLVTSSMQKAIRRADAKLAGFFALELFHSNFKEYLWKRLLTISAEDVWGLITEEIWALYSSWKKVHDKKKENSGRIFVSKAVILLCHAKKCRDADILQNMTYDEQMGIEEKDIQEYFDSGVLEDIPEYAFDVHTKQGRQRGMTKKAFFKTEELALKPRAPKQLCLFG